MRIGIAVALCALILPAGALAKGPTTATITGPGLAKPLKLGGPRGWSTTSTMGILANDGGFFQVAWGTQPSQALAKSPTKSLGPKYRVVYFVPGPSGRSDRIRQELYPYAKGGLLTYTRGPVVLRDQAHAGGLVPRAAAAEESARRGRTACDRSGRVHGRQRRQPTGRARGGGHARRAAAPAVLRLTRGIRPLCRADR